MSDIRFCANCGRGLIEGAKFCPYCGTSVQEDTDAVSRNAIFERYEDNDSEIENKAQWEGNTPSSDGSSHSTPEVIVCYKCGNTIPSSSQYCPVCQVQLYNVCPKCGHKYSAQYQSCDQCGTNRNQYLAQQEAARMELEIQRRHQEEALRQSAILQAQLDEERRIKNEIAQEELKAQQMEWLEDFTRNHYRDIIQYGENISVENDNIKSGLQGKKVASVIFYILAGLSFIIFPCFSGTDYHEVAAAGFFFVLPVTLIIAIILSYQSNHPSYNDVLDSIRIMIERNYQGGLSELSLADIRSVLKKYGMTVSQYRFSHK